MKRLVWRYAKPIMFILCGFVSLPSGTLAQPSGQSVPHEAHLERLVESIGLDEKTLTEVRKVIEASKSEHQELRRKLSEADGRMRSLLEQAEPGEAAVMAQADTIGALETEVRKQRIRTMLRVRALLTLEQRVKLLEVMRTRRPRGFRRPRPPEDQPHTSPQNLPPQGGPQSHEQNPHLSP
jgi:Spy/CpxP family protein refolding chaperone